MIDFRCRLRYALPLRSPGTDDRWMRERGEGVKSVHSGEPRSLALLPLILAAVWFAVLMAPLPARAARDGAVPAAAVPGDRQRESEAKKGEPSWRDYLAVRAGVKGNLTTGYAKRNFYAAPFLSVTAKPPYFMITLAYTWFGNYQIYDAYGDTRIIGFHEPGATVHVVLKEVIPVISYLDVYGGYRYGISPQFQFRSGTATAGINLEIRKLFADFSFSRSETTYRTIYNPQVLVYPLPLLLDIHPQLPLLNYLGTKKQINRYRFLSGQGTVGYTISDRVSADMGYVYSTDFNNVYFKNTVYDQHHFRLGAIVSVVGDLSLGGGLNAGFDSMDYVLAGFDLGFMLKLFRRLKVDAIYRMDHHRSPAGETRSGSELIVMSLVSDPAMQRLLQWFYADGYYASKSQQKRNVLGSSFISHEFSFSVSCSL